MHWEFYFIYFALGCLVGCFSGLLGVGGGFIVVPVLSWIFKAMPETSSYPMHLAIATSLAVMVVTSISTTYLQLKKKAILWKVLGYLSIGMVAGSILGPYISTTTSTRLLEIIFGCLEFAMVLLLIFHKTKANNKEKLSHPVLRNITLIVIGFVASFLGSMLGVGGGIIIAPVLIYLGVAPQNAAATSATSLLITSIIGTLSQLYFSISYQIPHSLGYIYIPATLGLAVGSLIFTPLGVRFAHRLKEEHLKKIFIFVLVTFGIIMII